MSHADAIVETARSLRIKCPRILELGAYAHYSAQIAASRLDGSAVSHDISAASLRTAQARAHSKGYCAPHVAVAGDFHSLPFADDSFDIVFIASAVHHTWTPWHVLAEMLRVTKPGGVIQLQNEPVGRLACLYHFRGNRNEQFTPFEHALHEAGLSFTVVSPFGGSRPEQLFGMIENDRIPIEVYERAFAGCDRIIWDLDTSAPRQEFEKWLESKPTAEEIANSLSAKIAAAGKLFSAKDRAAGYSIPGSDDIWPLAYRIEDMMNGRDKASDAAREDARIFGAALKAVIVKPSTGSKPYGVPPSIANQNQDCDFIRSLRRVDEVLIDDSDNDSVSFENILPEPDLLSLGRDWHRLDEDNGTVSISNTGADNAFDLPIDGDGFLILRMYSVELPEPYFVSITVNGQLRYTHHVASSESHLAKVFIEVSDRVALYLHDEYGAPVDAVYCVRLRPGFVRLK